MASTANIRAVITAEDRASKTLNGFANNVDKNSKIMAGSLRAVKVASLAAGAAVGVALVKNFDNAIKRVDTLNNFPKVLMAMGASASDAQTSTDSLAKALDGLPTPIDEAASGVQSLVAAGLDVPKATKAFLAMNDALLASGQDGQDAQIVMQSLSRAVSAGSVDAATMQAALSRMPTVLQALSKETGKSAGELFKLYSQDPKKLVDAMIRLDTKGSGAMKSLQQQAKDATGGIGTSIDNMNTAITRGIVKIIDSIGKENVAGAIRGFGQVFELVLGAVAKGLEAVIRGVSSFSTFLSNNKTAIAVVAGVIGTLLLPALVLWTTNLIRIKVQAGLTAIANTIAATKSGIVWSLNAYKAVGAWLLAFARMIARAAVTAAAMSLSAAKAGTAWVLASTRASASVGNLRSLVGKKMIMGGIVITAAIVALDLVLKAVQAVRQAIEDVNNAAAASAIHTTAQSTAMNKLRHLRDHGTPAQQARAKKALAGAGGFAAGGFTGRGATNQIAGVVHKGEYVIPKELVNQNTGRPKAGGTQQVHIHLNAGAFIGNQQEARKYAEMLVKAYNDLMASRGKPNVLPVG